METNQVPEFVAGEIEAYRKEIAQIQQDGYRQTINKARHILLLAAGLILLQYVITMAINSEIISPFDLVIMVFFVGSFVAMAYWTKKKPYTAIVGGIVLLTMYIVLNVCVGAILQGGVGAFKGLVGLWWIKIVMFIALFKPLKDAKELQELKGQKN